MRLVAGSNPAIRTINNRKGKQMGYHDRMPPDYLNTGMGVINPLHEQQRRLTKLEKFLREIAEETEDPHLRERIQAILK